MNTIDTNPSRLFDRNFVLALASQMCFVIANTLMAHYGRWIEFLGGQLYQVGLIMGTSATLGLLLRPWIAQWINRLGTRTMWTVGYITFALASMSNLGLTDLHPAIYAIRACLFLAAAIVFASGLTYVSQTAPEHRRTEAIGILGAGGFVGMLVGPWLGDLLLGRSSEAIAEGVRQRSDFVGLFVIAAIANLLPLVFLAMMKPSAASGSKRSVRFSDFIRTAIAYWPGAVLAVDFVFGVCMCGPFIFVASFIDQHGLAIADHSVIGVFFACYAGWGLIVRLSLRDFPDRIGPHKVLMVGMMFMTVGMFSYLLVSRQHAWLIAVPALLTGTAHGLMFHSMTSLTIQPFPHAVRGTGSALALMALDLGTLLGAPSLGWIADHFGCRAMFAAIGLTCVVCLAYYARCQSEYRAASVPG